MSWTYEEANRIVQARIDAGEPGVDYRAGLDPVKFLEDEAYNRAIDQEAANRFGTPEGDTEDGQPAPAAFWSRRRVLQHIHDFARARRVAPWAVFGGVLTRVIAAVDPNVQLPPTIGSHASLNLFAGLVGPSGAGKDAAAKVARDAIDLKRGSEFIIAPIGSGEGLAHMFMRLDKEGAEQWNTSALVTIGEIDTFTALVKRQSSTIGSQLRQAAMGEQLGFFYVDAGKRMIVPEHRYRLCLIAGIQPKRAGALLDEADGGTPQRFIWLPATDPTAPDEVPDEPAPMEWIPPRFHEGDGRWIGDMYRNEIRICQVAKDTVVTAHNARLRGEGGALDGHAILTRLKVAAGLAILEGNAEITDDDWDLSGQVMAVSDQTRDAVVRVLAAEQREDNKRQAEAEATRTIVVQERVEEAKVKRVAKAVKRHLVTAADWVSHSDLRGALAGRDRQFFDPAMTALVRAGEAEEQKTSYHGKAGIQYRFTGGPS